MKAFFGSLGVALLLSACAAPEPAITDCQSLGELEPICGFQNPEDLELLPDGDTLVVSQMGQDHAGAAGPGRLSLFDVRAGQDRGSARIDGLTAAPGWGDPGCSASPGAAFSPHGIHLSRRADGRLQLLAVNHGGRESVEFFEAQRGAVGWELLWRGCVAVPEPYLLNDVVARPEGGFYASHSFERGGRAVAGLQLALVPGLLGMATGHVIRWDGQGITEVAGSAGAYPNGLQISADGRELYINYWLGKETRRLRLADGKLLATRQFDNPDNSQWDPQGQLLVATHRAGIRQMLACFEIRSGACPAGFVIYRLNPQTLEGGPILQHAGAPMGAATVAQVVDGSLYLGSFAGDRLLHLPYRPGDSVH